MGNYAPFLNNLKSKHASLGEYETRRGRELAMRPAKGKHVALGVKQDAVSVSLVFEPAVDESLLRKHLSDLKSKVFVNTAGCQWEARPTKTRSSIVLSRPCKPLNWNEQATTQKWLVEAWKPFAAYHAELTR